MDRKFWGWGGREKGKLPRPKGKREKVGPLFRFRMPLGNHTARMHARTHERNNFMVALTPSDIIYKSLLFFKGVADAGVGIEILG